MREVFGYRVDRPRIVQDARRRVGGAATWKASAALACALVILALVPSGSLAEDAFPRTLKTLDIDTNSRDVVDFNTRKAKSEDVLKSADSEFPDLPGDMFFATIDSKRGVPKSLEEGTATPEATAAAQQCPSAEVSWDPAAERRGWFQINYADPCRFSLYCNWIVDPLIDPAKRARLVEKEIDAVPDAGRPDAPTPGHTEPPEGALEEEQKNSDPPSYDFLLAGTRPCTLTCFDANDKTCTKKFLEIKASQIKILQLGK